MSNDNYPTDDWILQIFNDWYDPCPLDPYYKVDGLLEEWSDKTWVNPPYSNPLPWIEIAIEENKKGKMIAMLLKVDTSTKWFAKLVEAKAKILWVNGRLKHKTGSPAPFPSMIVILTSEGSERSETSNVQEEKDD